MSIVEGHRRGTAARLLALGAALALAWAVPAVAGDAFRGTVEDAVTGRAVRGARVEIGPGGVATTTDADGAFTLPRPPGPGERLTVVAAGFADLALGAGEIRMRGGYARIRLEPAGGRFRENVVVTATRTATPIADVPGGVSVLEREDLAATPSANLADALGATAGIHTFSAWGNPLDFGIDARGFTGGGTSSYLLVMVDGLPVNDLDSSLIDWNLLPLDRIQRVEVQRGPASAAYGDSAVGGVVHLFTRPVPDGGATTLSGGAGSYGERYGDVHHAGRHGRAGYSVSLGRRELDGYRERSAWEGDNLSARVDLELAGRTDLTLMTVNHWIEHESPGPLTRPQVDADRRQAGYPFDGQDQRRNLVSATLRHEFADGGLVTGTLGHRVKDAEGILTLPLEVQIGDFLMPTFDVRRQRLDARTTALDARYERRVAAGGAGHRLMGGVELGEGNLDSHWLEVDDQGRPGDPTADGDGTRRVWAVYLQDQIELAGPVDFLVGVRYDRFDDRFRERLADDGDPATVLRLDSDNDAFSPKLAMTWEYRDDGNLYAQALWGFRAPTVEQLFDQRRPFGGDLSNEALRPQRVRSLEAGVRQSLGGHLDAELSLYWLRARNEIEFDPTTFSFGNIGRSRHRGAELTLQARAGRVGSFLTWAYQQAEHDIGPAAGNQIKYVPRQVGSLGVRYGASAGWSGSAVYRRTGRQYIDDENVERLDAYGVLDVRVGYRFRTVELFLGALNALDDRHSTNGFPLPRFPVVPGPDLPPTLVYYPAPDRSIRGGVRWTIGAGETGSE